MTAASPDKTLLCGVRANPWPGAYIQHIAGARAIKRYVDVKIGRRQAGATTRKPSVSSSERTILPKTKLSSVVCVLSFKFNN